MSYLKNFIPINRTVCTKKSEASAEAEVLAEAKKAAEVSA